MAAVNIQLQGFTPANRDAEVTLTQEATGTAISRKPFLDGSLLVRDLEPGFYQVQVRHPNLLQPIENRRIRIFPQLPPTVVPIPVPETLFTDNPIVDIPVANLGGVQKTLSSVRDSVAPISTKSPGEAIRAADWNRLAGAVSDLAAAILELTQLVSPRGHKHPEITDKIAEGQDNLRRFTDAFGRSLLELRREIETEYLRRRVTDVLAAGGATPEVNKRVMDRVSELATLTQSDTPAFTQKLATLGTVVLTEVNNIAAVKGDPFRNQDTTKDLVAVAQNYFDAGTQITPEAEMHTYQRTTTATRGTKFSTTVSNTLLTRGGQ